MGTKLRIASIACVAFLASAALTAAPAAAEDDGAAHRPGRAAAHAALTDGADLPTTPPSLPELALEGARRAPDGAALGKKVDGAREAASQADQHANDSARAERDEAATRIAQSSLVGAVHSATADARNAASQARTTSTKAKAGHASGMPPHPARH